MDIASVLLRCGVRVVWWFGGRGGGGGVFIPVDVVVVVSRRKASMLMNTRVGIFFVELAGCFPSVKLPLSARTDLLVQSKSMPITSNM